MKDKIVFLFIKLNSRDRQGKDNTWGNLIDPGWPLDARQMFTN